MNAPFWLRAIRARLTHRPAARRPARGRLGIERLEDRSVPSAVSGTLYQDLNANGTLDAGEPGSADRTVYLDVNRNGIRDAGESSTSSAADGTFSFAGLADGTYPVAIVAPAGFTQTGAGSVNGPGSGVLGEVRIDFASPEPGVIESGDANVPSAAWANGALYVSQKGSSQVTGDTRMYHVDPATGSAIGSPVVIPDDVKGLAFDGTNFWGANQSTGSVIKFDFSGAEQARYQTGREVTALEWAGGALWIVDNVGKTLYRFDPATATITGSLALPNSIFCGVAFDGSHFWISDRDANRVFEMDPATGSVLRSFPGPGDLAYGRLAFDGQFLWLADTAVSRIFQYDIGSSAPARDVTVSGGDVGGVNLGLAKLGSVSGTVFNDANSNGAKDASEAGLTGWRVYLDGNGNSQFDGWERSVVTGGGGAYALGSLRPGTRTLAETVRGPGWSATTAPSTPLSVDGSGAALAASFGNHLTGVGPVGAETRVNVTTAGDQGFFNSTSDEGQVNSVASDAQGNYVVIWEGPGPGGADNDVFARMFWADGTPRTTEFRVNLVAARPQQMPVVAMAANGVFAVAWSTWDGSLLRNAVSTRVFNADGSARTGDIQVTAFSTKITRMVSGIAMDADGDFVVLLHGRDFQGFSRNGGLISFQRYNALGQAQGKVVQVVDASADASSSSVAMDAAGNFVVAWGDNRIYAQRYTAAGQAVGSRITTALDRYWPTVARNGTGAFVIASAGKIQLFNADGTARTGAIAYGPVDSHSRPALGIDAAGDVVVSWDGYGQEVKAQRFTSTGVAKEAAFLVNTTVPGIQRRPSLTMTPTGFVIVWQGPGDGGDQDVFFQRYSSVVG